MGQAAVNRRFRFDRAWGVMKERLIYLPSGYALIVEVAKTPLEISRGLMGRTGLPNYRGMLFVHPRSGVYRYWMQGVLIPLDIVWLSFNLTVVEIVCGAIPGSLEPLGSCLDSKYALEIAAGMAERYRLSVGDTLWTNAPSYEDRLSAPVT